MITLPHAANREVAYLFTGFLRWGYRAWRKLPVSRSWRGIHFLRSQVLVFGDLRFRYKRSSLSLCWWSLFSLFSGALYILFSHWSSLDIRHSTLPFSCSLSSSPRCVLSILRPIKPHFAFFSTRSTPFKFSLSLSISSLFSLVTLSPRNWIIVISSVWKSFSSEYRYFASLLEIAKYQESLFNNNLTSMISRSKHGLQILSLRCFTSSNQHEAFLGFYKYLWSWILSLFSLSSLRWDILVLACLRLNQTLAAQETDTRQISYFSG